MPTQLTTPIARSLTTATVDSWSLTLRRNADFSIDLNASKFNVIVGFRLANGNLEFNQGSETTIQSLPPAVRTTIRNFHTAVTNYMRTTGILPAGVDTQDV